MNWWDDLPSAAPMAQTISVKLPKAKKATPAQEDAYYSKHVPTKEDIQNQRELDFESSQPHSYVGHLADLLSGAASHTIPDTVGFFGDLANELGKQARNRLLPTRTQEFSGEPLGRDEHVTPPGSGPASQAASALHDRIYGRDVSPRSAGERYAYAATRGAADTLVGGPRGLLAGAAGGMGSQAAADEFPDSEWAPLIGGLVGGIVPEGARGAYRGAKNGRAIRAGASMPNYEGLRTTVLGLEGGGTLDHPNVSLKGAKGPMQVMPDTARDPGHGIRPWNGKTEADRVRVGNQLLAALNHKYGGDEAKVLAAYNAGDGRVDGLVKEHGDNWWKHLPSETRKYVQDGLNAFDSNVRPRGVPPMDPREMARAMRDPEAAGIRDLDGPPRHVEISDEDVPELARRTNGRDRDTEDAPIFGKGHLYDSLMFDAELGTAHADMMNGNLSPEEYAKIEQRVIDRLSGNNVVDINAEREARRPVDEKVSDRSEEGLIRGLTDNYWLARNVLDKAKAGDPSIKLDMLESVRNDLEEHHAHALTRKARNPEEISLIADTHALIDEAVSRYGGESKPLGSVRLDKLKLERDVAHKRFKDLETQHHEAISRTGSDIDYDLEEHLATEKEKALQAAIDADVEYKVAKAKAEGKTNLLDKAKELTDKIDNLTPAERQEMDASVDVQPRDSSHEKFTQNPRENLPANDVQAEASRKGILQTLKALLKDESGSYRDSFDKTSEPYDTLDPEDKLRKALKEAKPVSAAARKMYAEERSARASKIAELQAKGASLPEQLHALKGQLPRPDRASILEHFTEEDIKTLEDRINYSNHLFPYEKVNALTALHKLLGAEGVKIPTAGEIKLLSGVMSDDTIKAMLENRPFMEKFWHGVGSGLNIPRSLLASFDFSGGFRQGLVFVGRKEFWKAWAGMFKQFGSEKAFKAVQDEIRNRPTYLLMRKAGLSLTDTGHYLSEREEAFMSDWAEKIPVIGIGVHASNRAYIGFLNKLRADLFDDMIRKGKEIGIDYNNNPRALKAVSNLINAGTGRGSLGKLNQAAPALSSIFFSPRLIASRVQMLNPMMYARALPFIEKNPGVRMASREAAKSMLTFGAIAMTIVGLAKMGGAEVSGNPTSSDFGKIKIGNTRYDLWGGFQQYIRLFAELASGKVTTSTGTVHDLNNPKFGQDTRRDVIIKFVENKFAPVVAAGDDFARGKDAVGQPVTVKSELKSKMIPLVAQDIADAMQDQGYLKGVAMGAPSLFGVGVQTYKPKEPKPKNGVDEFGFPVPKQMKDAFDFPKTRKKPHTDEFGFPQ